MARPTNANLSVADLKRILAEKKATLEAKSAEARMHDCPGAFGTPCPDGARVPPDFVRCPKCSEEGKKHLCATAGCGTRFKPEFRKDKYCLACHAERQEAKKLMHEIEELDRLEKEGEPCGRCQTIHVRSPNFTGEKSLCPSCLDLRVPCGACGKKHFTSPKFTGDLSLCVDCRKERHEAREAQKLEERLAHQALEAEGVMLKPKVLSPLSAGKTEEAKAREKAANELRKKRQRDEVERLRTVKPVGSNNGSGDPKSGWKKGKKK